MTDLLYRGMQDAPSGRRERWVWAWRAFRLVLHGQPVVTIGIPGQVKIDVLTTSGPVVIHSAEPDGAVRVRSAAAPERMWFVGWDGRKWVRL